jgi:hypothetical protein
MHGAIAEAELHFARQVDDELPAWSIVPKKDAPRSLGEVSSGWDARSNSSRCECPSSPVHKRVIPIHVPPETEERPGGDRDVTILDERIIVSDLDIEDK